jgi:D-aspartate ligase
VTGADDAPVLILGGQENAISITRNLGRRGIRVSVCGPRDCIAFRSRFCRARYAVPDGVAPGEYWSELLLGAGRPELRGSVVFGCSDDALEFLAAHQHELERDYLVEESLPRLRLALLDKQRTLELARSVGVPTPRFWSVSSREDVDQVRGDVGYPVLIKPIHSHVFQQRFGGRKFFTAESFEDLAARAQLVLDAGLSFMVCEFIPGPDSLLSSYYTYLDREGRALFHFTKRVFRRSPVNRGGASYHITEWIPETAALGEKFFRGVGLLGLGNVEFKRDPRDGELKIIESNARFTAAHELMVRCGMETDWIVYCHLTRRARPAIGSYREHMRMLYPWRDFAAYRELSQMGSLTLPGWLRSIAHPQVLPLFALRDPWPSIFNSVAFVRAGLRSLLR